MRFRKRDLSLDIVGMSDVMPYPSTEQNWLMACSAV